ncbi:MAG: ATP synthase F0 subunit B [Treponema sp.]|nr:ATP synthase F0 subunit B [Treponema sp.]
MLNFSVTFLITIINITILFFILRAVLFKPVTKFMADRSKRIQDSIEQSEKDKNQAKALLAQYEAQLKTAETEAEAIIRAARENAEAEAEKIIAESRVSAEAAMVNARKQLETEQRAALAIFRKEAATLVVAAAGRLVEREIKAEDSQHYADMLLGEIEPSGSVNN